MATILDRTVYFFVTGGACKFLEEGRRSEQLFTNLCPVSSAAALGLQTNKSLFYHWKAHILLYLHHYQR